MQIKELLNYLGINSSDNRVINDVVTSTNDVTKGCTLILTKGHTVNPILLLNDCIKQKCDLILTDEVVDGCFFVENLKNRVFEILDYINFRHQHGFKIIGITGTEGKSSLANIIHQGLNLIRKKSLLISNENNGLKGVFNVCLTTPSSSDIIDAFKFARDYKYEYVVMEISSIGICENRIDGKVFDYLFLTNLEVDHLDYHGNIFQYHLSKISLFQKNIKAKKFIYKSVVDKYPHLFKNMTNKIVLNDEMIKQKRSSLTHQVFSYMSKEYYSHLIFKQNRYNLVMLIEFLKVLRIGNIEYIVKKVKRVKGRLDLIHSRPYIMIDYAHSSKGVERVLCELNNFKQNRLIIVIGAGGNRDNHKRSEYGKSCLRYGDLIFVTNDNPRKENPSKIANMIMVNKDERFIEELNRKVAIRKAIKIANEDDIVVILGRGNEEYQIINDSKIPLNDYEEAKKCFIN